MYSWLVYKTIHIYFQEFDLDLKAGVQCLFSPSLKFKSLNFKTVTFCSNLEENYN